MTDWASTYSIGPHQATLDMTYDGATIPQVTFADFLIAIQARPAVTTTVKGLEFFLNESRFWSALVEGRLPVNHRTHQAVTAETGVSLTTVGTEDRADVVTTHADITGELDSLIHIGLTWDRVSGVVMLASRTDAKMLWDGWEDFLDIHEQFLNLIQNGKRVL